MTNELPKELEAKDPEFAKWYRDSNLHKPIPPQTSLFKSIGESIGESDTVSNGVNEVTSHLSSNPYRASLAGAAYMGIPAYLLAKYLIPESGIDANMAGGISALLGGAAGYGLHEAGKPMEKPAYFATYIDPQETNAIASKLAQDPNLNVNEENQLLGIIQTLPRQNQSELGTLLSSASGAAVGMLVARYLLKMGITGQLLVSLAGAAIGYGMSQNKLETAGVGAYNRIYSL